MIPSEDVRRPPFEYRCLGPASLRSADGRKLPFRTRKQMALFTYLLRRAGEPQGRDHLIDLLWSEDEISRARHSLSQTTSLINKLLQCEAISVPAKDELVLREGVVWADVAEFERCAAQHRQRDARALWHGNLLEGIWVHNAPGFERWLEVERRRLHETMRRALHELIGITRTEGDWEQMRSVAESLLELDPLDETAMLAQLVALTLLGDRTLALRRYTAFEARLSQELGAEPGPEMRAWAKRQRSGGPESAGRLAEAVVSPVAKPLYGRASEFGRLWQAWDAARGGTGGCVVLLGPAGIGKSALVAKLVDQVRVAGGAACTARCFPTERCVPFAPISALVRQMADLPGFVALSQVWISELSRLAPELRERFPNAPPALAADDSVRHRVCEATCRAGESISYEEPLLLVVDNVQDADETTVALLHYFGRQVATQRTLLVYVTRAGEAGEDLGEFGAQARAQGYPQLQRVGPLEDVHLQRIVADVLSQRGLESAPSVVASMARVAGGNPLHATELALAIPAEGGRPAAEWLLRGVERPRSGTERFEASASTRLAALSAAARSVTAVLAVAARPLAEHELQAAAQLAPAEFASALFELDRAQLLRRDGARLGFAHDTYASLAGSTLDDAARRAIHARLAAVLAESAARNPAAQMEVALHLERAGSMAEARAHALAAAEFAGSVGALRERTESLELALRVTGHFDAQVAATLAACQLGLRQFERVYALCDGAHGCSDLSTAQQDEFRYLRVAADFFAGKTRLSAVCTHLQDLLGTGGERTFLHRADAMRLLMRIAYETGSPAIVRATARTQRRAATGDIGGHPGRHALFASAYVFAKYYWPERALPLLERARQCAEAEQDWEMMHACRDGIGVVLNLLGRYSESIEAYEASLALARRTSNPQAEAQSLNNIAVSEIGLGDFEKAAGHLHEAAHIDRDFPRWPYRAYRFINQGEVGLETGMLDDARSAFETALQLADDADLWTVALASWGGLGLCAAKTGDWLMLRRCSDQIRDRSARRERFVTDRWKVEAAIAWNTCVNDGRPDNAVLRIDAGVRELARRDIAQWLRLELEAIRVQEFAQGRAVVDRRNELARRACAYDAAAIVRAAREVLPSDSHPT